MKVETNSDEKRGKLRTLKKNGKEGGVKGRKIKERRKRRR